MSLIPVILVPFMVMAGFFVNQSNIPYYFYPIQYLSMFKFGFQAAVIVILFTYYHYLNHFIFIFRMNFQTKHGIVLKMLFVIH